MANCNHDCNSCKSTCSKKDFLAPMNAHSHVKKVIGVVSGKGGVGKSSVTSLLALAKQREGYKVAILDGDITGPSIGRIFGVENKQVLSNGKEFTPVESSQGIKIMSTNLLLESNDTPVIDMPPGTGDVPLTVFQSLPLDGIIIVTSPQELVGMIVSKAVNMAKKMDVDIIGIVENMSYVKCPDCDKKIYMFGKSHSQEVADRYQLPLLGQLPIDSELTQLSDQGYVENYHSDWFDEFSQKVKDI